jgi:hypothetical protein
MWYGAAVRPSRSSGTRRLAEWALESLICEALEDQQLQQLARIETVVEMPPGSSFVAEAERRAHPFNVTAGR